MDNKCSKYEGLFIFSDEKTLQEHIESCEECKLEPEAELVAKYEERYQQFKEIYPALKPVFAKIK